MSHIVETSDFSKVLEYSDKETLVLLDVDNTLIEPKDNIGGVAWFKYGLNRLMGRGLTEAEAVEKIYAVFVQLQEIIEIKPVEEKIPSIITQLHEKNIKTMGLTARGVPLVEQTARQLASIGIHLHNNTIFNQQIALDDKAAFVDGVLSIEPEGDKGAYLLQFLERIGYTPKKVLFIDDIQMYLDFVDKALLAANIPFVGILYKAADRGLQSFNPATADEQLEKLLSHEKFQEILKSVL